jgi:DMSO/TMAO reductase YedYZ molybdopterin-dependent catalytic subunit
VQETSAATVAGVAAATAGVAAAELLAAVLPRVPSPLDALGAQLVAAAPGRVSTWAVGTLGAANRPLLLVGSVLVVWGLGALLGRSALRAPGAAVLGLGVVAAVALVATLARPDAAFPTVLLTIAGALAASVLTYLALVRRAAVAAPDPGGPAEDPRDPALGRRAFLGLGLGVAAGGLVVGGVARQLGGSAGRPIAQVDLPAPARALPAVASAQDLATRIDGVSPVLTPTSSFFRIDTAFPIPSVDPGTWSLSIDGAVERPLTLTYDDLLGEELVEVDATIACVSNEVGGDLIGTARWLGVPLATLLERAGPTAGAEQVLGRSVDGWTGGFPLEVLDDGRPAVVAVGMNGEPLPARHGFPARLVVPGLFGYVSATKWLAAIELTSWDGVDGYWIPRGWSKLGPIKTASRIDRPGDGATVEAGEVVLAGVAWAPTRGIDRVEVAVDDGPWTDATLVPALSDETWVQWHLAVELAAGAHRCTVRAVDGTGEVQPEGPAAPAPDGAEGWHAVRLTAR